MARRLLLVILVAFLNVACDAATSDAQEETCVDSGVKKELVQARKSLEAMKDEEEDVAADAEVALRVDGGEESEKANSSSIRRKTTCPWFGTERCHENPDQRALCKDGTYSFRCNAENRGERQKCPCNLPYMCASKTCGGKLMRGKLYPPFDYCCEKTCKNHGGIRPCDGKSEAEPTGEPMSVKVETEEPTPEPTEKPTPPPTPKPTPPPTPPPKKCYAFHRSLANVLGHGGFNVHGKSHNDQRNTAIVYNHHRSSSSVQHYQGMGDWENEGAVAAIVTLMANGYSIHQLKGISEDNQRNTIIVLASHCSGYSVGQLQGMKTLEIAQLMNKGACCPGGPR